MNIVDYVLLIDRYNFIYFITVFLFLHFLINFLIIRFSSNFKFANYSAKQKIHNGYVSRYGGIIIVFIFLIYLLNLNYYNFYELNYAIITSTLVLILSSLKEDIYLNTSYKFRLFFLTISALIITLNENELPDIFFFSRNIFFNFLFIKIVFYSFCILILINGINFIDGANGLASFSSITILLTLLFIDINYGQSNHAFLIFFTIISILPFLIFNFPFGVIFLGDTGAYWLGLIISIITIKVFSGNSELSPWLTILILLYPTFEVLFSFLRKLLNRKSPFKPDIQHLHMLLFFMLKKNNLVSNKFSSLVTLSMMPIWIAPLILTILALQNNQSNFYILFFMIIFIFIYLFFYFLINQKLNSK